MIGGHSRTAWRIAGGGTGAPENALNGAPRGLASSFDCSMRPARCIPRGPVAEIPWKVAFGGRILTGGKPNGECRMKITLLGTGTPTPSLKRMSSGYMVQIGEDTLIFDCGPGSYHRMMEAGVSATQVTHIFLSHLHYDHCLDYQRLVLTHWDQGAGKVPELNVFGPSPLARINGQLFAQDGVWGPDLTARTKHQLSLDVYTQRGGILPRIWPAPQVSEIQNNNVIEGNDWKITVGSVVHAQPELYCFGFRLECPDGVFVYSGDTGPCKGITKLAKDCNVLASMCHYLTGTSPSTAFAAGCMGHMELAELGEEAGVQNLVISHVTTQIDQPGVRERMLREMASVYSGNLFMGEDLMEIPVGSPLPPILD